jgi:hypothetical protein
MRGTSARDDSGTAAASNTSAMLWFIGGPPGW